MKNLFRKIPLQVKLLLIGMIPLAFAVFLALDNNRQKEERLKSLEDFKDEISLKSSIGDLSSLLLTERRVGFGFRMNRYTEARLLQQHTLTDRAIALVDEKNNGMLGNYKRYTLIDQLPAFRGRITRENLSEIEILDFYTPLLQRLNTLVISMSEVPPFVPGLEPRIASDNILLQMANAMAVLRSDIYYALQKKTITESFFEKIRSGWVAYRSLEFELMEKGDSAVIRGYREVLQTESAASVITILKEIDETGNILLSSDAEKWWNNSIKLVDDIRGLKATLVKDIQGRTQEKFNDEKHSKNVSLAILLTVIFLVIAIIHLSIRSIWNSLGELGNAARRLSVGELGLKLPVPSNDVIGQLAHSIQTIDTNKQKMAEAAVQIGQGNFNAPLQARSENDVIGNAMLNMRSNLLKLSAQQEEKIWMQESVRALADSIQGVQDVQGISGSMLESLAKTMRFEIGVFYIAQADDRLHYVNGYALEKESVLPKVLQRGQSLAGQAFAEKRMLSLEVPENFYNISTAAGKSAPRHVLIFPVIHEGEVEGVLELGRLEPFEERGIDLLHEVSEKIGVALQAARSRSRLQELLEETQAQAEELQVQHTEMENLNAELEAHTQKLQASEEELRVQQEELQQANAELEERTRLLEEKNQEIAERTIEIQAKAEQLEASTRYKSEFLANMSHELRTPLNSILLLSRLMTENKENNLSSEQVEYARVIQSSGQGLLLLIDEILDLSKIEAGKMSLEIERASLPHMLSEMKAMFEPMAREKNLKFSMSVTEGTPEYVETDRLRLEQVIRNLISNSLKFTKEGSISLEVKPERQNRFSITVSDTGIGIPRNKQELIFDAFQQADGSTRRKFGGTGLGLSISRELVKLLGGTIRLESEPGKGSRFTITLPAIRNTMPATEHLTDDVTSVIDSPPAEEKESFLSHGIPESIPDDRDAIGKDDKVMLIIEDDVNFARSLMDFTKNRGYKALSAVRGDEGIELARRFKPTGVLLDIQLPIKNGWQVMEELKNDPQTRHIPVHIMSSHQVRNQSLLNGAINFIHKPVAYEQMNEIFQKIEHVISKEAQKVLIFEENPQHARALAYFLESSKINTDIKDNVKDGVEALSSGADCVVLDMGIPNQQAYEMLEKIKKQEGMENIPVIVFTGKSLSAREQEKISRYADSIVIKTAQSYQRILSEVSLFLHVVETREPKPTTYKKLGALNEVLKDKKVLVVDDDVRNIFSLSKALEKYQVVVVTATDGKEALIKLSENPDVDVVLLDMMMPEMDGYETAKKIRENTAFKNLPVIAVTAKAMTGDREKCIQAGASDYITKPVDTDQLLSLLRVWLYEK